MNKIQVSFDFETYSECDLKECGAWVYSQHPSTEVICMAYAYCGKPPVLWLPGDEVPYFMTDIKWKQAESHGLYLLKAWNSFFEYAIMKNTMGIEPPPLCNWEDTMAIAAAMGLPSGLGDAANVLQLEDGKDKRGKKLIQLLSVPQKSTKNQIKAGAPEFYRNRDPLLLEELYEYCKQDARVEQAISKKLLRLNPTERELWELDQEINIRGIQVDSDMIDHCIAIYEGQNEVTFKKLQEMSGLDNPNSGKQFLPWLQSIGYTEDNLKADTLKEFLKRMNGEQSTSEESDWAENILG